MNNNVGIILKSYQPQKCKLALLDREAGKIMAVPNRSDLSNGALITYQRRDQENLSFIHSIDIVDMPFALAQEDIIFVHHVLELCYYFIPQADGNFQVFRSLLRFYEIPTILSSSLMKKIFVIQLFSHLGVQPYVARLRTETIEQIMGTSIDFWVSRSLDCTIERELDVWLLHCIKTHPFAQYFKTSNFLSIHKAL